MTALAAMVFEAGCRDCDWDDLKVVRLYLIVYRQAHLYREPFEDVLRNRVRDSRAIDPAVRGRGFDAEKARAIAWSLDAVLKAHGWGFLHPDNALAVATALCPQSAAR